MHKIKKASPGYLTFVTSHELATLDDIATHFRVPRSSDWLKKLPLRDIIVFESVYRLEKVVGQDVFCKWLRTPTAEIDGFSPIQILFTKDRKIIADLVDDMLTGAPM